MTSPRQTVARAAAALCLALALACTANAGFFGFFARRARAPLPPPPAGSAPLRAAAGGERHSDSPARVRAQGAAGARNGAHGPAWRAWAGPPDGGPPALGRGGWSPRRGKAGGRVAGAARVAAGLLSAGADPERAEFGEVGGAHDALRHGRRLTKAQREALRQRRERRRRALAARRADFAKRRRHMKRPPLHLSPRQKDALRKRAERRRRALAEHRRRRREARLRARPHGKPGRAPPAHGKRAKRGAPRPRPRGTVAFEGRRLPATCACRRERGGRGVCYHYTDKGFGYCARRSCRRRYVCAARKTGLRCMRRKTTARVVPHGHHRCKTVHHLGYMYVPYVAY